MKNYKAQKNKLLGLKKKLLILGLLTTGAVTVTGCGDTEVTEQYESNGTNGTLLDEINGDVKLGDTKVFEEGEHYIVVRVPMVTLRLDESSEYAINNIPDGYSVYTITPYTEPDLGNGSETGGHDIWFVNDEPVEVTATYNEHYKLYGYYSFGKVLQKTK